MPLEAHLSSWMHLFGLSQMACHSEFVWRLAVLIFLSSATFSSVPDPHSYFSVEFSVVEEADPGTFIGQLSTVSLNASPPYTTYFTNVAGWDDLDVTPDGVISMKRRLDREVQASYKFVAESLQGTHIHVSVHVKDINDNSPVFSPSSVSARLLETYPLNVPFFVGFAEDLDREKNGVQRYDIINDNRDIFSLRQFVHPSISLQFELSLSRSLDSEEASSYLVMIRAFDGGSPSRFEDLVLNITVVDVNDNMPILTRTHYSASVVENASKGTSVLRVDATDKDSGRNGQVEFFIEPFDSAASDVFVINHTSGLVSVNATLNFLSKNSYFLLVTARDGGSPALQTTASMEIRVLQADHNSMILLVRFLIEGGIVRLGKWIGPHDLVAEVTVVNSSYPVCLSTESVVNVTLFDPLGSFALEKDSNSRYFITLTKHPILSHSHLHRIRLTASDSISSVSKNITVLLEPDGSFKARLTFTKSIYFAELISTAPPGVPVFRVEASGAGKVTFKIVTGKYSSLFKIDLNTGLLTTSEVLGCSAARNYTLSVMASDVEGSDATADVVVNVIQVHGHPPKFLQHFYQVFVDESLPPGSCFKKVFATDQDCDSERIRYSLGNAPGHVPHIQVNETTGELCLSGSLAGTAETVRHLAVVATDKEGLSATTMVQVVLTAANRYRPVFTSLSYNVTLPTGDLLSKKIAGVLAVDRDQGVFGRVTYHLDEAASHKGFGINSESGVIHATGMHLLDGSTFRLSVIAVDGGNLTSTFPAAVTITTIDSVRFLPLPFSRSLFSFTLSEDVPIGHVLGTVASPDLESSVDLRYSLVDDAFSGLFSIEKDTGVVSTAALLDREKMARVLIAIRADYTGSSAFAQLRVSVVDTNDNSPEFFAEQVQIVLREDLLPGSLVYTALARDGDFSDDVQIQYRLTDGEELFSINRQLGEIKLKRNLNYESQKKHVIRVTAVDSGIPPRSATLDVSVIVLDVNDNSPTFMVKNLTFSIAEQLRVGSTVGAVSAVDADSENNGTVTYLLNSNTDEFEIDKNSGIISTKVVLDHEMKSDYLLIISVADGGIPTRVASTLVRVLVLDVNEFDPKFVQDSYVFFVEETHRLEVPLGYLSAVDLDKSSHLTYLIIPPSIYFNISPESGMLTTLRGLDREEIMIHLFSVFVIDRGSNVRNATTNVTVIVTDINDHSPKFIPKNMEPVYLDSDSPAEALVGRVFAVDEDCGENQTVFYHLHAEQPGRHPVPFVIDRHLGIITTKVHAREMKSEYSLKISAQDSAVQPRRTSILLRVFVSPLTNRAFFDTDENAFTFAVEENCPIGTVVGLLSSSGSTGPNNSTDFFILQGNQYGTFHVNSSTSQLYVERSVDYETAPYFNLKIKAVNRLNGSLSRYLNVSIFVIDLNDNSPQFLSEQMIISVDEDIPEGTIVCKVQAFDADSGHNGTVFYSILSQKPSGNYFLIEKESGALHTSTQLDYERERLVTVVVVATDNPVHYGKQLSSTMEVLVQVRDVNDNVPQFNLSAAEVYVFEDVSVGIPVCTVSASDADSYENGRVTFSIQSGNEQGHFQLNPVSGLIALAHVLDREATEFYQLRIAAQDHGKPQHETTTLLTIRVADVNDNVPTFAQTLYNISVLEELPAGTLILTLEAIDLDDLTTTNANLFFYLPDIVDKIPFTVDNRNGGIILTSPLDRESKDRWIITVRVSNVGQSELYDSATVVVNVLDVNDNKPVFLELIYSLDISENANVAVVHTVEASDRDYGSNGKVTYSIQDDMGGKFSIDPLSGKLSCLALDREVMPFYNLTILATDGGQPVALTSSMQIMVNVLDDNDNDPIFRQDSYSASIPEDIAEGTSILLLEASDLDEGPNAEVSFSLSNSANGFFVVDSVTGVVTTAGEFDREKTSFYSFEAFATDGGLYGPRSRTVRVDITVLDVNDNAPVFVEFLYRKEIPLDFPVGQTVLTISATDKDAGQNGQVFYSLSNHSQYFSLDPVSGQISTKRLLDISAVRIHTLHVKAQDRADKPRTSTGVISIQVGNAKTTGALRFVNQTYSIHLVENAPPPTNVLSVQARFASGLPGPGILYSFANGNEDNTFNIHPETGLITVMESTKLDFESNPRLRLIVIATAGSAYDYTTIWINLKDVNDNAPRFPQHRYATSVWEGNVRGTYVTQVLATDPDSGANGRITYGIISGNVQNAFIIDPPNTGIVRTNAVIDRETCSFYRLEIEAWDSGKPSLTSTVTLRIQVIDINDNAPRFPDFTPVNIREGTEVGTMIVQVSAVDSDLNPTLVYGFALSGNEGDAFSIDRYSGKVFVAKRLDHETCALYNLTVSVSDEVHNSTAELVVAVIDDNDNAPVFDQTQYQVSIPELTEPDVYVMTVRGSDADSGENGRIEYSLISVNGFYINATTGAIFTSKVVVFNKHQQHIDLIVTAKDHGVPPLSQNVVVMLKVIDVNNHAPVFSAPSYSVVIKEDLVAKTTILQVIATDEDHLPENTRLRYSIISGNDDGEFLMNDTTGIINLAKMLDHEQRANYTLTVSVSDSGTPSLISTSLVLITVTDVNDNSPRFSKLVYEVSVREDVQIDSSVLTVAAVDRDSGENARIQYSIVSGSNNTFSIDRDTGVISVRTKMNYESRSFYLLNVSASDCIAEGPRRSTFTEVWINVTDVNEHRPQFSSIIYVMSVVENQPNGTYVFTAEASDRDGGEFGLVRYSLIPENPEDEGMLHISSDTGIVSTSSLLTYSIHNGFNDRHHFKVFAEDAGGLNTSIDLYLSIEPEAMKPHFLNQSYRFVIPGSAQAGDVIGQVQAVDKDEKPSIHIIYFLQTESEFFAINRTNGVIFLLKGLQRMSLTSSQKGAPDRTSLVRSRRARETESLQLIVIAQCGFPDTKKSTAVVDVLVDRLCELCSLVVVTEAATLTGTHLILLIVFLIVAVVMVTVIGGILLRSQRAKNCREDNSRSDSSSFETIDVPPPPMGSFLPPPYIEVQSFLLHNTTSEMTNRSQSASSGRGSVNKGDDVDEEIQLINSEAMSRGVEPDSGLLIDDLILPEPYHSISCLDGKRYRKSTDVGLGMNSASVESLHHFSDEGGGEGDGLDIEQFINDEMGSTEFSCEVHPSFPLGNEHIGKQPGSHSTSVSREEELSSFDWDYFVSWKPEYSTCVDVYKEIALLKDKNLLPRIKPTQFVIQPPGVGLLPFSGRTRLFPPPIITDAPPHSVPGVRSSGRNSNNSVLTNSNSASSGQTSQLNSVSLPKSAFSYESAFTESPSFSSPYTPSLSPVGTCSPAVSAWNAPTGLETSELIVEEPSVNGFNGYDRDAAGYSLLRTRFGSDLET